MFKSSCLPFPDEQASQKRGNPAPRKIVHRILRRPWRAWLNLFRRSSAWLRPSPNVVDLYYRLTPFKRRTPLMTPMGFKMAGGNSVHHRIMMRGDFEKEEVSEILPLIGNADVFVDVGANIGYYACLARQKNKHVIAVEPQSANYQFLCENLLANGWEDVEVYPVGLGKKPGLAVLFGASSTGASTIAGWAGGSTAWRQAIPVSTLDVVLAGRFAGRQLLIKIDVEGVEYDVLLGASATLARNPQPTFIVEICLDEFNPDGANPNFRETFRIFQEHGYEAHLMDRDRRPVTADDVERWARAGKTETGCVNYLFAPRRAS